MVGSHQPTAPSPKRWAKWASDFRICSRVMATRGICHRSAEGQGGVRGSSANPNADFHSKVGLVDRQPPFRAGQALPPKTSPSALGGRHHRDFQGSRVSELRLRGGGRVPANCRFPAGHGEGALRGGAAPCRLVTAPALPVGSGWVPP